jgi:hypothetical protein
MSKVRTILLSLAFGIALLSGFACEREGPAERAGEQVDETTEDVRERAEEATER